MRDHFHLHWTFVCFWFSLGYDSVAGGPHTPLQRGPGTNQSRLHVVYRANQTYPRFLVILGRNKDE